jgi:hypothetical protein
MRTALLFRFLSFVLLCFGSLQQATASHVLGGDISYTYIPGSTSRYHIVARLYSRDPATCGGCPGQNIINLAFTRNGCSLAQPGSFSLTVPLSQNNAGGLPGCPIGSVYRVYAYETDVTLPPDRWTISTIGLERTNSIRNLIDPSDKDLQISAFLDNSSGLINSSPRFNSFTMLYSGGAQPYRYSFSAFEPDGDSLVYQSAQPLAGFFRTL